MVAASDVGGHKELIRDGNTGKLFKADNSEDLAKSLDALFANRADWPAIRNRARQFVEQERSWHKNIYRYEPVYHSLLGQKGISRAA
jgi:glycogen synthase